MWMLLLAKNKIIGGKMKKQKLVIVSISLCAFLIILNNYVLAQSTKEQQLTKEQIEAFRSAETVRIVVESYQDDKSKEVKNVNMFIEALVGKLLKFFGLQVLSPDAKNYDLEIKIKTRGITYIEEDTGYVTPLVRLEGSKSFEIKDIPIYTVAFSHGQGDIAPETNLELIKEYRTIFSENKGLYRLMIAFEAGMIYTLGKIYGISGLITRLKDENAAIRKYAARSLVYTYDPRAVEPLIEALKDKNKDVRVAAVVSLGYFYYRDKPRIIESLIAALKDEDKDVRMRIDDVLQGRTLYSFDGNHKKWKEWWEKNKERFIKNK